MDREEPKGRTEIMVRRQANGQNQELRARTEQKGRAGVVIWRQASGRSQVSGVLRKVGTKAGTGEGMDRSNGWYRKQAKCIWRHGTH